MKSRMSLQHRSFRLLMLKVFRSAVSFLIVTSMFLTFANLVQFHSLFVTNISAADGPYSVSIASIDQVDSKEVYTVGDLITVQITFMLTISSDYVGSATYQITNDVGTYTQEFELTQIDEYKWAIIIPVTDSVSSGTYVLKEFYLDGFHYMNYRNRDLYSEFGQDLTGSSFQIAGTSGDHEPPVVNSIVVNGDVYDPYTDIDFTFDITEFSQGVHVGLFYKMGSTDTIINAVNCYLVDNESEFCRFTVNPYHPGGEWQLAFVRVTDSSTNWNSREIFNEVLYPDAEFKMNFDEAKFSVIGTTPDITAPTLNQIILSSNLFPSNQTLTIQADATDSLSGVAYAWVELYNTDTNNHFTLSLNRTGSTELLNFFNRGLAIGHYEISSVRLVDFSENTAVFYDADRHATRILGPNEHFMDFSANDFQVLEAYFEDMDGYLSNVSVSPKSAVLGSDVRFELTATGEVAEASSIKVYFDQQFPQGADHSEGLYQYVVLENQGDGNFVGYFDFSVEYYGEMKATSLVYSNGSGDVTIYDKRLIEGVKIADLSGFDFTISYGEQTDTTPPVLDSITIDKHFPNIGEFISFDIVAHDDESEIGIVGISFRVNGELTNETLGMTYGEYYGYQENYGLLVSQFDHSGLWEIDTLSVSSLSSNITYYNPKFYPDEMVTYDFSDIYFTISGTALDEVPPVLNSIEIVGTNAGNPLDAIHFEASYFDEVSGVKEIYVSYSNQYGDYLGVQINGTSATTGSGELIIPKFKRPGIWKVNGISISDNANNWRYLNNSFGYESYCHVLNEDCFDFSNLDIEIYGVLDDSEGPLLTNVSTEFDAYINNGYVYVDVEGTDQSWVDQISLYYISPSGVRSGSIGGYAGHAVTSYQVQIQIPGYGGVGKWKLTKAILTDVWGNTTTYLHGQNGVDLSGGDFTIIGRETKPTLLNIDANVDRVTANEEVGISIMLKNDIVLPDEVEVHLISTEHNQQKSVYLNKQVDGSYFGRFLVGLHDDQGVWNVDYLSFINRYGIEFDIKNSVRHTDPDAFDMSAANFEVYGTTTDLTAPEITHISIESVDEGTTLLAGKDYRITSLSGFTKLTDPIALGSEWNVFRANERIKFLVEAREDISGLEQIRVTYQIFRKQITFDISLEMNEQGIYEGEVEIENYYPEGSWSLVYFEAVDAAGNKYVQDKNEIQQTGYRIGLNQLQFTVTDVNEDIVAPVLDDLAFSSRLLRDNETLVLTAHATDIYSGIGSFEITLMPYYYSFGLFEKKIQMFLMDDGSYQGELKITENTIGADWGVKDILIKDRAGNQFEVHNLYMYPNYVPNKVVLSQYDFQVDYLASIELIHAPNKLVYGVGEEIDLTGLVVLGRFLDGTEKILTTTPDQVFEFNSSTPVATQSVYILVENNYVRFQVTITDQVDTVPPIITLSEYEKGWTNESICVYATVNEGSLNAGEHCFHEKGSFEFVATDEAGNESRQTVDIVNIDKTLPTISVSQNLKFTLNSIGSIPYLAFDLDSGLIGEGSGSVNIDTSSVGTYTVSISVMDQAGNQRVEEVSYQIVYDFLGFQQPINTNGSSIFKAGSTIPVKFKLSDALGTNQADAIASLTVTQLSSNVDGVVNELPINISASSTAYFRYDDLSGQYILNLSTKGYLAGKYRLTVNLNDGTNHSIEIGLKK